MPHHPKPRDLKAVYFDAGGTLLKVEPSVGHIYARTLERLGHAMDPDSINRAFGAAWARSIERRRAAGFLTSDAILREEWRMIVADSLDGGAPPEVVEEAFEELFEHFSGPEPWMLARGARETLEALRNAGLWLGVLSNWDSRLPRTLEALGVGPLFDGMVVSHAVGVEKPHPGIFRKAQELAGVPPQSILLVGDSLEQDIMPALGLGWQALWLSPLEAPGGRVEQARSFAEVLERLLPKRHDRASGPALGGTKE